MNLVSQRRRGLVNACLNKAALQIALVLAIALTSASHASATPVCADSVLSVISSEVVIGSGGSVGCFANSSLPGLTLYTTGPITPVLSNSALTVEATWIVGYSGPAPASTTIGYAVVITGTPDQSMTWALEVGPQGGSLSPVAGSAFLVDPSGTSVFDGSQLVSPIYPGNYTIDLTVISASNFTVEAPANASVDLVDPTPSGVPEPASVATLGIGLAAGFLFLGKLRKKQ